MISSTKFLIISFLLFCLSFSYLQLQIAKIEMKPQLKKLQMNCITKSDDEKITAKQKEQKKKKKSDDDDDDDEDQDQDSQINDEDIDENKNYQEICYEKDIAFVWPIYFQGRLHLMSMDTTLPVSWIKGAKCHIEGSSKKCSYLQTNFKETIKSKFSHKEKKSHSKQDYAMIQGSSELVKGIYQKTPKLSFKTRDTSRLANFFELMALGFYMAEENQTLVLQNTLFINATEISKNLNYLADGGISLRFDDNSEKSFLQELFNYQNNIGKVATIWIKDKNGLITIGDTSTKHSENGFGGIDWVSIKEDDNFGRVPTITDVIIDSPSEQNYIQVHDKQYPAIISLSASYIGLPVNLMTSWKKKISKKAGCEVNETTKYLQCHKLKPQEEDKILTFVIDNKKISFALSDLILGIANSKTILNLKVTAHDNYLILGEPLFQKYLVLFDYGNNKVGFSTKRDQLKELINPISLIRFICFVFVFGCSFIVCFAPIKRCVDIVRSKGQYQSVSNTETRRLKPYGPIQENPYQELSTQIDEALKQ